MDAYNFWRDLLDTYPSLSDWMKALWLVFPPAYLLAVIALAMRHRTSARPSLENETGTLLFSVHRDEENRIHVIRHFPAAGDEPGLMSTDPPSMTRRIDGGLGRRLQDSRPTK